MKMQPLVLTYDGIEPTIDPTAWLAPNATVIGNVEIGPRASVFYGAVVRADMAAVRLGAGSNLQDNVVVHEE
jgi:carbonic anhydrase/acetyltransferase-like protein (isoleucine patch superfamily)